MKDKRTIIYCFRTWAMLMSLLCLCACRTTNENPVEALAFSEDGGITWGLLNTDGNIPMPAGSFNQRPSTVVESMFSVSDKEGRIQLYSMAHPEKPVNPRSFSRIGHFFEEVTWAQETSDGPVLLIDKQGNILASTAQYPQYDIIRVHNFSEGRALFQTGSGKYGYMDTRGEVVIPPLYDVAYDFSEGIALIGMHNNRRETGYQFIDLQGKVTGSIRLSGCLLDTRFSDGRLLFKELHTGHFGWLDKQGDVVRYFPETILRASRYREQLLTIHTETGTGCLNSQGEQAVPTLYEDAFVAGKNRIAVRQNGRWGLIDASGQLVNDFRYDSIGFFYPTGFAVVKDQGRYLFIDREGHALGNTYSYMVEDSTANHLLPQVFLIKSLTGGSETVQSPSAGQRETVKASPPKRDTLSAMPKRTHIEHKNWKQIAQAHPFYQEAVKVVSGKLEEQDAENREMILNYVEHLRTSYTTKDIDFLEQLFSENALIVVGTVVHTASREEAGYLSPTQVVYNVKNKRQYLDRLKQVFQANRTIEVQFSDFRIMRHPTLKGIYGVSLRQEYQSNIYSDDGYLFLLWDFRDETAPQIHVRTWQPRMQADHTPLPEDEIFDITHFNLQ